jgi:hypothetical protein
MFHRLGQRFGKIRVQPSKFAEWEVHNQAFPFIALFSIGPNVLVSELC